MSIEALAEEARNLAESYVIASAVRGREQSFGPSAEDAARRVEHAAFHRFLDATDKLSVHDKRLANDLRREALLDAMHAASASLRDALNAQRGAA